MRMHAAVRTFRRSLVSRGALVTQRGASTWPVYGRPPLCKIVATIGPASEDSERLPKCVYAGMRIMRINFSHATREESELRLKNLPLAHAPENKTTGSPPNMRAVLLDTQGPEIRLGGLAVCKGTQVPSENRKAKVQLDAGAELFLTTDPSVDGAGDASKMFVNYERLPVVVQPGTKILLDDGIVMLEVAEIVDNGKGIRCIVKNSNPIGERKSLCVPGIPTGLPAMSAKDKADIRYGVGERDMDIIAASFVRSAADVREVREFALKAQAESEHFKNARPPLIVSKVETVESMDNFDEILAESDGIMVARGDLGVEMALEEVTLAQKKIVAACALAGKPVIVATQMLDSMSDNPRPTRAEVSDVTNAVHDGADAVMLSGESANGQFSVESIATMRSIIHSSETSSLYPLSLSPGAAIVPPVDKNDAWDVAGKAAVLEAHSSKAQAIVADGPKAGELARRIAKHRPTVPVMVRVSDPKEGRQLMLHRGLHPVCGSDAVASAALAVELGFAANTASVHVASAN